MSINGNKTQDAPGPHQQSSSADYCYVRFRGPVRDASVKFFFHESTLFRDIIERARNFGEMTRIEFPRKSLPFTEYEYNVALSEGRVVF